jgi:hypothetical protein
MGCTTTEPVNINDIQSDSSLLIKIESIQLMSGKKLMVKREVLRIERDGNGLAYAFLIPRSDTTLSEDGKSFTVSTKADTVKFNDIKSISVTERSEFSKSFVIVVAVIAGIFLVIFSIFGIGFSKSATDNTLQ